MKTILLLLLLQGSAPRFTFETVVRNRPGLGKEKKGGEDAWFAGEEVLAVADGVGGWNEQGVDPGIFSRMLITQLERLLTAQREFYVQHPKELLVNATRLNAERGTSTFVVASIDPVTALLRVANIGDSGYFLLSRSDTGYVKSFRSVEQQHAFNFPFQVGTNGDDPESAEFTEHPVAKDDILIVASDGLFDNLFDEKIVKIVNKNAGSLEQLAQALLKKAFQYSIKKDYKSPFSVHAQSHGLDYAGGKNDDITVVVGRVSAR